jgi:cytochrome c oxidase cbb3-type subunit I/II
MEDPRSISVGSNMPNYGAMLKRDVDVAGLSAKLKVQRMLGVPYPNWTPEQIAARVKEQATAIAQDLRSAGAYVAPEKEVIALIAYLQQLGRSDAVPAAPAVAAGQ